MIWSQDYDPFHWQAASTLVAALPIVVLLSGIGIFHMRAHIAALAGLATALAVAIIGFGMPVQLAGWAAAFGAAYGLFPIGWIILNIIFLYKLTNERGQFDILRDSIARVTEDSRIQLLLIAFCFGAFFEGAAGFGAPVAVTGAMLIGLGFTRLQASGLSLIANTAPVAFGALGTPIVTLAAVTALPVEDLSALIGRQMTPFALVVPFWLLVAYCGLRRTMEVWPAALVAGVAFSVTQLAISNLHGPWLAAVGSAIVSIGAVTLLLRFWQPATIMHVNEAPLSKGDERAPPVEQIEHVEGPAAAAVGRSQLAMAWAPWLILTVLIFLWGLPFTKAALDGIFRPQIVFSGLDQLVQRVPPVVTAPAAEPAIYNFNILTGTGTAILLAGLLSSALLRVPPAQVARTYAGAFRTVMPSLLTIAAMLALGYLTRYAGVDATMGLAFATTGFFYPFFGTLLGWLGVAVTGSDTASNVLFGGLQKVTAEQLYLSPTLMTAANSSGGVMGKMIDAQSIVVASTATQWFGQESRILRYVFVHSLVLGALVGCVVMLMAYVWPFTLAAG
ncbi:L-lactate permease [Sphingomonas quercus]|uniref:L-lactate permease n=1 Tax=Sphingomonas quercus TaxID=2842451 RepID=A0ABS6BHE4_9SPHN|nr:L-lactate permease [Sphingomonas quercus]MBU3076689.1 L-lactate permease [Sphingomonas quercus]